MNEEPMDVVPNEEISEQVEQVEQVEQETTENTEKLKSQDDHFADILSVDNEKDHEHEQESIDELTTYYSKMNKEALLAEIKELIEVENIDVLKLRANLIRNAFNNIVDEEFKSKKQEFLSLITGNESLSEDDFKFEEDSINVEFKKYYSIYRERRQAYIENKEKIKKECLAAKNLLLEELRELLNSEDSLKKIYDDFNAIQEKWKQIGQVPRSEVNTLWQNYHFLIEKFYDKVKINRELRDLDMKKNLDAKIELCEKAEGLILEESISNSFKTLQDLHQSWKEIGPVPSEKNEEIWERFKSASDKINSRRIEYYEELNKELDNNLLAKKAICEQAEEVLTREFKTGRDWNQAINEMNDMLKLWKTIGKVPQKDNEEIWSRFKSSLNTFFANKKEVFDKLREDQDQNYNLKVEICLKAESIVERSDWRKATQELLDLQKDWKSIGYVNKKLSDKVWNRFRAACDKFFEKKSEFYSQTKVEEADNIIKKQDLIKEVKAFEFGENKDENLNTIKDFQRKWSDIGFISNNERERLHKEFREAIDYHFEKLQIDSRDFKLSNFQDRVASGADSVNVSRERRFLIDKINKLKEDLNLWENNIGFLAQSKQADILKAEFDKKMQSAKQEIALCDAKIKMIDEVNR